MKIASNKTLVWISNIGPHGEYHAKIHDKEKIGAPRANLTGMSRQKMKRIGLRGVYIPAEEVCGIVRDFQRIKAALLHSAISPSTDTTVHFPLGFPVHSGPPGTKIWPE